MPLMTQLQATEEPPKQVPNRKTIAHEADCPSFQSCTAESAEYFALAARATNDALRDWDVKGGNLAWPEGLDSLLGHPCSEIAENIGFWHRHVHPEDRARTTSSIQKALAHSQRWSGEYRFRRAEGTYVHLLERAVILRNENGEAVRFIGSLMDVTARKQLQDQLLRSQRMEAFGQLASGVAHDFNNFLTTILGYSSLLLQTRNIKGDVAKHITEIRGAATRAATLTGQLLAFSRKHPLNASVVEVNTLVSNLERSLLRLLGENITVQCDLHRFSDGGYIKVDENQMTQIILNLAVNARDAMPNGGRLTVATGSMRIVDGSARTLAPDQLAPGEYVTINVSDTGSGMSDEIVARLFEPFFSTKAESGTGLGLATSYGIIRQSGGQITVESKLGCGTTFTIALPKVPTPPRPAYKKANGHKAPTGSETILVLEDDIPVRHLTVRCLRSLGYEVLEAAHCDDAQRLIKAERDGKIHLLITDIVMPQMSGRHFADWMRQASPQTRVILISGYLDESLRAGELYGSAMFFLPKPFDAEQLAVKVREALDARS